MLKRSALGGALAAILAGLSVPAAAAEPPCSTAKLIVPWGAGGDTYIIFKVFEETVNKLNPSHQLQVVTIPGQGGNKGAKEAAKSKPDGCTLFAIHQSAAISYLNGRIDFTWDAFEPVARLARTPDVLAASGKSGIKSYADMVKLVKADPSKAAVAATFGSTSQFAWLILGDAQGLDFKYVPFDGTAQRVTALLANTVQLGSTNVTTSKKHFDSGELVPLVLLSDKKSQAAPNIPTSKELGLNVEYALVRGVMAPKGTPKDVVAYWAGVFEKATKEANLKKQFEAKETDVVFAGPAEYRKWWEKEYAAHEKLAIKIGMYKKKK
jgi:tripartite-type tricarboxylate transporter receptor subunit TctC